MQIPTITMYINRDTGRTGRIIELDKNNINTGAGRIDYEGYVTLCGLIEEEEVLIVLNNTILNYIGLQFGLAQPPNEFVYILI